MVFCCHQAWLLILVRCSPHFHCLWAGCLAAHSVEAFGSLTLLVARTPGCLSCRGPRLTFNDCGHRAWLLILLRCAPHFHCLLAGGLAGHSVEARGSLSLLVARTPGCLFCGDPHLTFTACLDQAWLLILMRCVPHFHCLRSRGLPADSGEVRTLRLLLVARRLG